MPNHLFYIIMDSCRYDSFVRAKTPSLDRLGATEKRFSYASWTSPSHYAILMGMVPHTSPQRVFASEVYKKEYLRWVDRLEVPNLSFKTFVPALSLAKVLGDHGYQAIGRVSLPVLNPYTSMSQHFHDYKLMKNHNDFAGMVDEVAFPDDSPRFYFFNLGETHYPYMLSGENLPHISGVHGTLCEIGKERAPTEDSRNGADSFFKQEDMARLHQQQVNCVEYVDGIMGRLFAKCPPNTYFIVTADHGELFGEDGYFGHGPIMHDKVFEVPYIEGLKPG